MACCEIIDKYLSGLRQGFHCVPGDKRLRVITPYLYPDNDLIEVFIEDLGSGRIKVTDLGEVFRHLHSQALDVNSSPEKKFQKLPYNSITFWLGFFFHQKGFLTRNPSYLNRSFSWEEASYPKQELFLGVKSMSKK